MAKNIPLWTLTVLLALALACMPLATPVLTEEPGPPQEAFEPLPSQTPVSSPTQVEVATGTPVIPAPTGSPQVPVTLILTGNSFSRSSLGLLGGYRDGEWLGAEQAADFIDIDEEFRTFILDGPEQVTHITSISRENGTVEHCNQPEYTLWTEEAVLPFSVGLNAGWPVCPRPVEWLSNQNEFYLQALDEYLLSAGVEEPALQVQQVLKADLDGDGTDEVLLAASRFIEPTGHSVTPGDYSLVLMRKLVSGEVITQRALGEVYTTEDPLAFPPNYSLQGILDVNADGRLEVLVYRQVWEGYGSILFELHGDRLEEVLRLVCGL